MPRSSAKPWGAAAAALVLALSPLVGLSAPAVSEGPTAYLPHAPISIDGDAGFNTANGVVRGSGTPSDPFVIEGWEIASSATDAIAIRNTEAFVVIRNVYISAGSPGGSYADGIYFAYVANAIIEDSAIEHGWAGMGIWYSDNIVVRRNRVTDAGLGAILVCHSTDVVINGNLAQGSGDGILLIRSLNVTITGNDLSDNTIGMQFFNSGGVLVRANDFLGNRIQAEDNSGAGNAWDGGYPAGGNYWSNYVGVDLHRGSDQTEAGPDGMGDSPMAFPGGQDRYPLMTALAPPSVPPGTEPRISTGSPWVPAVLVTIGLGAVLAPLLVGLVSRRAGPRGSSSLGATVGE